MATHEHECQCGNVWEHDDSMMGNKAAHTCSNCGAMVWWRRLPSSMSQSCKALFTAVRELLSSV